MSSVLKFLKTIWEGWKKFAHILGRIQTVILLTVFYFLILGPVALISRLFGKSFLIYRGGNSHTYWIEKPASTRGEEQYFQQY